MNWIDAVTQSTARQRRALLWHGVLAALAFLYGCSTSAPPTHVVVNADLSVRAAHEAGAEAYAPTSFRNARGKLEQSKRALEDKRYEDARRLAESAQVDAELAEAQAEARIMRQAADRLAGRTDTPPTAAELDLRPPIDRKPARE
jgi:hypothetical protein